MFDVIRQLCPNARRYGTIGNAGESNSTTTTELVRAAAKVFDH